MEEKLHQSKENSGIKWLEEDVGLLLEGDREYTLFSIREEEGGFFLYIAGEGWKKERKPVKVKNLQQGRRITEAIVRFLKKSDVEEKRRQGGLNGLS